MFRARVPNAVLAFTTFLMSLKLLKNCWSNDRNRGNFNEQAALKRAGMKRYIIALVAGSSLVLGTTVHTSFAQRAGAPKQQPVAPAPRQASAVANPSAGPLAIEEQNAFVNQYCSRRQNYSVNAG